jgi:hypothetical protein
MKLKYTFLTIFLTIITECGFSQKPAITWQQVYGGNGTDKLCHTIMTADGGFVLCGYSNSPTSGDKTEDAINNTYDFWIVKLSAAGVTQWTKTYGGSDRDLQPYIIQTSDSGYLLGGSSISPASGNKTENPINQSFDYWVLKLDSSGNVLWDNTIGGIQFERLNSLIETRSGYYISGSSNSAAGYDKTAQIIGSSLWPDFWVVKINKSGAILWDSTYGGKNRDELQATKLTADGGILLAGTSYSPKAKGTQKTQNENGNGDYWMLKIDSTGKRQWDKTIGGVLSDYLTAVDTINGNKGFILAGYSNSPASFNKTDSCRGQMDYWIVRTNQLGKVIWAKSYGGSGADYATSIKFYKNKIFVGGYSNSGISGDKTAANIGGMDFWTLTLDMNGNILNQFSWGNTGDDYMTDFFPLGDTALAYAGYSNSPLGGDKKYNTVGNTGLFDYWIFKTTSKIKNQVAPAKLMASVASAENLKSQLSLQVFPNPVRDVVKLNYSTSVGSKTTITVYSNNGNVLIINKVVTGSSGTFTLNVSSQSAGVYYVLLQNGTSAVTKKFIKQ